MVQRTKMDNLKKVQSTKENLSLKKVQSTKENLRMGKDMVREY